MLRRVLAVIVGVVVAAVVAISWLGLAQVPVLSATFGMDRARDLGMQSDRASFEFNGHLNKTIIEAGITIDSLELQEGAIYFKGTRPKTITADAPNPSDIP